MIIAYIIDKSLIIL